MPLVLCLLFGALCHVAYSKGFPFPSTHVCSSPTKSWEIQCQKDKKHEGVHTLTLRNRKTSAQEELFTGGRWSEVLWSPNETNIAITDWAGSNCSEIFIRNLKVKGPAKPLAVAGITNFMTHIELIGHCYWEAMKWESDGRLRFRIFGHTDEQPFHQFAYEFLFDLDKKSVSLVARKNGIQSNAEQQIWDDKQKTWKKRPTRSETTWTRTKALPNQP